MLPASKILDHVAKLFWDAVLGEDVLDRLADDPHDQLVLLARPRSSSARACRALWRRCWREVADPRHDAGSPVKNGRAARRWRPRSRRLAIDIRTDTPDCWLTCDDAPRQPGDLLDDLLDVRAGSPAAPPSRSSQAFWSLIAMPSSRVERVVRADDRADPVLQRRDDPAAVGVVLGVGREDHAEVEVRAGSDSRGSGRRALRAR